VPRCSLTVISYGKNKYEISGSHGGKYEENSLLEYIAA